MIPVPGAGSMVISGSGCGRKVTEVVPEQFPAGLRVLVVDDDSTCLVILERMLKKCSYEVTKCQRAEVALSILRENKNGYDIVLSDVHMPDMDGFKLLEHIGLEMDLPVIMMSADEKKSVVLKGVTHGACDYLIKPVRMEALMNIWQHVVRKKRNEWKELENSGSVEDGDQNPKPCDDGDYSSTANEGNWQGSKRKKDDDDDIEERDDSSTLKKPRVVWSVELHQQFVAAVNQLSIEKAVPKKILELMNVPGLTRENVASHLQKYRLYLRRVSGVMPHQVGSNGSFMGGQEMSFGHMPPLGPLDLQTLGVPFSAQGLAAFQVPGMGRPVPKSMLPGPLIEQNNNIFSFEGPPKMQFGEVRAGHPACLNVRPGLLHGVPSGKAAALKRLPDMQQQFGGLAVQRGTLMLPAPQPPSTSCDSSRAQIPRISSSGNGMPGFSSRNGTLYNSQASPLLDFPSTHTTVFSGACGMKSITGNGVPGIPAFDTRQQQQNTEGLGGEMSFDPSRHTNTLIQNRPGCPGVGLFRPGFCPGQTNGIVGGKQEMPVMDKDIYLDTPTMVVGHPQHHTVNPVMGELSPSFPFEMASETTFDMPSSDSDKFGQDDLLNSLLKQEYMVPFEGEFDLDGFVVDDILV